jgi:hypothetical protein
MFDANSDVSDVQNGLADKENVQPSVEVSQVEKKAAKAPVQCSLPKPSVEVSQVEKKAAKAPVQCSLPKHSYPFGHDKRRVSVEVRNC